MKVLTFEHKVAGSSKALSISSAPHFTVKDKDVKQTYQVVLLLAITHNDDGATEFTNLHLSPREARLFAEELIVHAREAESMMETQ